MLIPLFRPLSAAIGAACLLAMSLALAGCGNPVAWDDRPARTDSLINYHRTPHFVFFYDINSYLRNEIEANGKTKEAHLARLESELGVSFDKEIMVRLISESGENWSGQAYPREPYFIQETRGYFVQDNGHEIAHIVSFETLGFPPNASSSRGWRPPMNSTQSPNGPGSAISIWIRMRLYRPWRIWSKRGLPMRWTTTWRPLSWNGSKGNSAWKGSKPSIATCRHSRYPAFPAYMRGTSGRMRKRFMAGSFRNGSTWEKRVNTVFNEYMRPWKRATIALAAMLLSGTMLVSCDSDRAVTPGPALDSLTAVVEGFVLPEADSFQVTLSRGASSLKSVSHEGYFQFKDVEYGLYILIVTADGYGEYRRSVIVGQEHIFLDGIQLGRLPWPITQWLPSDSIVLQSESGSAQMQIQFSRDMDKHSVEAALSVEPSVPFRVEWAPERNVLGDFLYISFEPDALAKNVKYVLTLAPSAKTLDGASLEAKVEYSIVDRRTVSDQLVALFDGRRFIGPGEGIRLRFSKRMVLSSVTDQLFLKPPIPYRTEWDLGQNVLWVIPETRWPAGQKLEMGLYTGYATQDGIMGSEISSTVDVDGFRITSPWSFSISEIEDQVAMEFNLPIDLQSLRFSVDNGVVAIPAKTARDRVQWSFSGFAKGSIFTLKIDSLVSVYGDDLELPASFIFEPTGIPATFRFMDSAEATAGLLPNGDNLELLSSWAGFTRLKASGFSLIPAYPAAIRWGSPRDGRGVLTVGFPQPIPAGMEFKLFPDSGAIAGDTLVFKTQSLLATLIRPYYGEEKVSADQAIAIRWNTPIDTLDFASHVTLDPPVDSLWFEQEALGAGWKTVIRHTAFAKNKTYTVAVKGVTDLFARPMEDSLMLRFNTAP